MNRLQKNCMVFSLGLHGLLAVILFASLGFGTNPRPMDLQVMTMIPARILDRAGAGGGTPIVKLTPEPQPPPPAQPRPQPQPPPQPQTPAVRVEPVEPVKRPTPRPREETPPAPKPDESEPALESKPPKKHEVQVSYAPAKAATTESKSEKSRSTQSSARAEARRLKEIERSLDQLASGVQTSGSPSTIVDVAGIGGGEAFAGYKEAVASYYYRAWIPPDNASNRLPSADARVTIARDGSIMSAELVRSSGDKAVDKSVERALREVTQLPPFPASTRDTQRTYVIQFNLHAKEMSG